MKRKLGKNPVIVKAANDIVTTFYNKMNAKEKLELKRLLDLKKRKNYLKKIMIIKESVKNEKF